MYKTIMALLNSDPARQPALDTAVALAKSTGSHMTGLYVNEPLYVAPDFVNAFDSGGAMLTDWTGQQQAAEDTAKAVQATFREICETARLDSDWRHVTGRLADVLTVAARSSDLLVMASHGTGHERAAEAPAEGAIGSGCPVLLLPAEWGDAMPGSHVLIAWNASREATRAIREALPLLHRAKRVEVVAINARQTTHRQKMDADIKAYLARHDIIAHVRQLSATRGDVSDVLQKYARDTGADLVCLGAYGHARLRELVLGGVTRELLHQPCEIPLFFAH